MIDAQSPLVDLHTHSNVSDGELPPAEVVRLAARAGLAAVALTDHDTVDGLEEALAAGAAHGIEVIPGCELSVRDQGREMHLLGLWTRPDSAVLRQALIDFRAQRDARNRQMVEKLRVMGIPIRYEDVLALSRGTPGRPHMARLLVDLRVVRSSDAAFRQYLGRHGRAYVAKQEPDLRQAVEALRAAGGTVALAHPYLLGLSGRPMEDLLRHARQAGVEALEAYYPEHSFARTREYVEMARRADMAVCGGSDFHGAVKPGIALGTGRGRLRVPLAVLEDLKARRRAQGQWV
uniref:PHP domain-containing protein n=1 Tax=Fundidesulfovibrio putealis TaxID=270496 RepID=A0A7C4EKV3_9BACT